jgi:DNA-binding transcriptional ArsR family regulator
VARVTLFATHWQAGPTADLGLLHDADRHTRKLNHMVQFLPTRLDVSFAALSDATRRGVLEQLGNGDASITELADRFHMTLTGMKKHVGVLEQAGLVTTQKVGRVRTCKLGLSRLAEETAWIEQYRRLWASRFDALDQIVEELKQKETFDGRGQTG